jgi:hypothetical protein
MWHSHSFGKVWVTSGICSTGLRPLNQHLPQVPLPQDQ